MPSAMMSALITTIAIALISVLIIAMCMPTGHGHAQCYESALIIDIHIAMTSALIKAMCMYVIIVIMQTYHSYSDHACSTDSI